MNRLEQQLADKLQERHTTGNLRRLTTHREPVDFFSNDYLGIATGGILNKMIAERFPKPGATGSTGSRLLSGNNEAFEALEHTIASFHKAEAALVFNSGYDANTGLISSIALRHTTILYDELCHASIIDGVRLSLCSGKYKFRHNDLNDLQEKLLRYRDVGSVIVVVESVYSMDGDMAPLTEMAQLCLASDAQLIVDEAHATGIFGPHGEGLVCALGLEDQVFARIHTFGKALGCHGAAIVGSSTLKQYLINFSRSFIYTTALPQHSVQAIDCAYNYLSAPHFTNQPLHDNISYIRQQIKLKGITGWAESNSPIQVRIAGSNEQALSLATQMREGGLQVKAILSPTVPGGSERVRVCLHSFNTSFEIDRLLGV